VRRRLVLANLVLILAVLAVLEVPFALVYSRHEHDALNTALQRDAAALAALSAEVIEHPSDHDVYAFAQRFSGPTNGVVTIVDPDGRELTRPNILTTDPAYAAILRATRAGQSSTGEIGDLLYVAVPLGATDTPRGAVVVARSDESIDRRVHQFWLLLVGLGVGVLGASLLLSSRVSRWVVDPLRRLDRQAAALGGGDLSARAVTRGGPPEVVALAVTFNEMADRLDELVTSQRRFVADASHQLRGPLTALRLRLEGLDGDDPTAIDTSRDAALGETARLTRLVDGLLSLARAEGQRPGRQPIDTAEVLADRQEAWAPLAAEQQVTLRLDTDPAGRSTAPLVPGHLEQILDNLIDNALDASPPGTTIVLRSAQVGDRIEVHVVDEGRGMTDDELARAFDPFWQSPSGPTTGSTGLGLAIAEQLVRASRGTITLARSDAGGVDAALRFPSRDGDAERGA
jgi:signal transduction histidine kinase